MAKTRLVTLLVGLTILLRIPSLFEPYWYGDEGIYLTLGEGVRQGLVLYRDIFDHKPPFIYLLAALAGSLFWFKFILLVWHALSVALFWKLTEILFDKNSKQVVLATSLYALLTTIPLLEGNIANSELFMAGSTIVALLLLFRREPNTKRLLWAGILFSVSILFKVPAIFDLGALCAFWVLGSQNSRQFLASIKKIAVVACGTTLPIAATLVYFASRGGLREYISTAWTQNFPYIAAWMAPSLSLEARIAEVDLSVRSALAATIIILLLLFRKHFNKTALFASIWLTFALFAALLSARPYPHYIIQVVPPLALLVGILAFGREKFRFLPVPFIALFLFSLVFYKFYYYPTFSYYKNFILFASGRQTKWQYFENFDRRMQMVYEVAETVANRTGREDRIFIWGTAPELYALSRRLPAGRYTTSFHIRDFSGQQETISELEKKNPKYIIVLKDEKTPFPQFFRFLQKNYLYLETIHETEIWKAVSPTILKALYAK